MKYVLLLRGINVGGKNKAKMDGLKQHLSGLGFLNVMSYINSGNLIFESDLAMQESKDQIRRMLAERYPFEILFALIDAGAYAKAFIDLPDWWYGELARRDVLFFTDEVDRNSMVEDIRGMRLHCEAIHFTDIGVFWGKFDEKEYLRTAYHKQVGSRVYYKQITIRNGNTAEKILAMLDEPKLYQRTEMNWIDEAAAKLKLKNQVLFAKDSEYLQDLTLLFQGQDHRVMALWALDLAAESVALLEAKYPGEKRPREALEAARDWAAGNVKMRFAQRKILDCHAVAKEITCKEDIAACHAIGQACAVVHTAGHALGYPIYDLTALIYKYGIENCAEAVERRKQEYIEKLLCWNAHLCDYQGTWAAFMLK